MAELKDLKEVSVRFVTKEEKKVPDTPFTVPITLARYGLSEIVNHFLHQEGDEVVAYEFLIEGQFLRTTLEDYLKKAQLGKQEAVIELEYTQAAPQPEPVGQTPHPDWISSIDIFSLSRHYHPPSLQNKGKKKKDHKIKFDGHRWAVTGCYDGQIRLWDVHHKKIEALGGASGHSSAVKAVHFIDSQRVVSASKDCTLRFWKLSSSFSPEIKSLTLKNYAVGHGHDEAIECLSVCPPADPDLPLDEEDSNTKIKLVSGGWDKRILLWQLNGTDDSNMDEGANENKKDDGKMEIETEGDSKEESKRKRKRKDDKREEKKIGDDRWQRKKGVKLLRFTPLVSLDGHKQCVSTLAWASHSASSLYSGSWDYNIFLWDTIQAKSISAWNGRAVISGMDFNIMANLLATSHHDQMIRLWDPRQKELQVLKVSLRSHKGWCSSVAWNESNPRVFASTSYDQTIKLWDIRSTTPIHTISAHTDKVLSIKHVNKDTWLTGGADRQLRIHST